jgi:hypothetical protein
MVKYSFVYNDKEYELREDNCSYMLNDEEHPVSGIEKLDILELMNQAGEISFELEYYDQPCGSCLSGSKDKEKFFRFLEYHFFIFTKNGNYIISNISREYEDTSFNKLLKKGLVDNSYVVSIAVCMDCGEYSIEIEQCDI